MTAHLPNLTGLSPDETLSRLVSLTGLKTYSAYQVQFSLYFIRPKAETLSDVAKAFPAPLTEILNRVEVLHLKMSNTDLVEDSMGANRTYVNSHPLNCVGVMAGESTHLLVAVEGLLSKALDVDGPVAVWLGPATFSFQPWGETHLSPGAVSIAIEVES
jgi:hypothetical protein